MDSDDVDNHITGSIYHDSRQKLGLTLDQNQIDLRDPQSRRYNAFTTEDLIEQYVVEQYGDPP